MCLATSGAEGHPTARMVLLRGLDDRGLRFYTSYFSRKGRELSETRSRRMRLLVGYARTPSARRRIGNPALRGRVRRVLRIAAARPPPRRLGIRTERAGRFARDARRTLRAFPRPLRGRRSPAPALVGRLPDRAGSFRILARPPQPLTRSRGILARRRFVDHPPAIAMSRRWAEGTLSSS